MCEPLSKDDLYTQIEGLVASGKYNGEVLSALQSQGYEVIIDPLFGVGIGYFDQGEKIICYHPKLVVTNKTADP